MYLKKSSAVLVGIFAFLSLIVPAKAEDISGTWVAKTQVLTVTMVFKVDGKALTGSIQTHPADETQIKDGKVDGDNVSFYIMRNQNNKKVKIRFKGVVEGDQIRFTREADGAKTNIVAKRSQPKSAITI